MKNVARTLRDIWEERGISAQELATRAGVSTGTVYRMNQKEFVSGKNVSKVCRALDIEQSVYEGLRKDN